MSNKKTFDVCHFEKLKYYFQIGCHVPEVTFLFDFENEKYEAVAVSDTPYHLAEAIREYDKKFININLQSWKDFRIIDMGRHNEPYNRYKVLSIKKV